MQLTISKPIETQYVWNNVRSWRQISTYISYFAIISATNWLRTCACSLGGPGRNRDEQRGGRSTLGTDF